MTDSPAAPPSARRVCPSCGTSVSATATRCVVCGVELRPAKGGSGPGRPRRGPQLTMSLPLAVVVLLAIAALSIGGTFAATRIAGGGQAATPEATITLTPTETHTPAPTATETPAPTATPLPPIEITLPPNFYCVDLAALYDVTLDSILRLNPGLRCEMLSVGQTIYIPQPTPTQVPPPTETLSPEEATLAACQTIPYTVESGDALSSIAANYNVSMQAIIDFNGMPDDTVYAGQILIIPLCQRNPTPGPTPTPTPPPPYPAPSLLLPQDGAAFTLADDTVTLQWASVATLRETEFYQVVVEDITEGSGTRRVVAYVTNTTHQVPVSLRPNESLPHVMRWWVTTVRLIGTNAAGQPIYASAGGVSARRDFTWSGAAVGITPTP